MKDGLMTSNIDDYSGDAIQQKLDAKRVADKDRSDFLITLNVKILAAVLAGVVYARIFGKLVQAWYKGTDQTVDMSKEDEEKLIQKYKKQRAAVISKHKEVYKDISKSSKTQRIIATIFRNLPEQAMHAFAKYVLSFGIFTIATQALNGMMSLAGKDDSRIDSKYLKRNHIKSYMTSVALTMLFFILDKLIVHARASKTNTQDEIFDVQKIKITKNYTKIPIKTPKDVYKAFGSLFGKTPYEIFALAFLDDKRVPKFVVYTTDAAFFSVGVNALRKVMQSKFDSGENVRVIGIHNHPPHSKEIGIPSSADITFMKNMISILNKESLYLEEFYTYAHGEGSSSYYRNRIYYSVKGLSKKQVQDFVVKHYDNKMLRNSVNWQYIKDVRVIK